MLKKLFGENPSPGLTSKILLPLLLGWLLVLILAALFVRQALTNLVYSIYNQNLSSASATIETSIEHGMYTNDFHFVQQVVQSISRQKQVGAIRVLNNQGRIVASSLVEEMGVSLPAGAAWCRECHTSTGVARPTIRRMQANVSSEPVMVVAYRIENQIACQSCHSTDQASLGVILTEFPTTLVDDQLKLLDQGLVTGVIAMLVIILALAAFVVNRQAARPLQRLAIPGGSLPKGDYPYEVETLSEHLDNLYTEVGEKNALLDTQRRGFQALVTLSESIDINMSAEKVLHFAIGKVQEVTGFVAIGMRLFDSEKKCFRLVAQSGMTQRMVDDLRCIPAEIGFTGDVYKTHRAAYTSNLSEDQRLESPSPPAAGYQSLISVPLLSGDRLMGSMELATKEVHIWQKDEVRWLELMGRSIGTVLHHIETSNQLQGMAVMHERSRLAQEIHDGLAQLIGTLRVWAEHAQLALKDNKLTEVHDDLQKIEQSARDAYGGLREEILGLRDILLPGRGITTVIREFLNRYQRQWNIETILLVSQNSSSTESKLINHGQLIISPAAEIQLLRIIQEGLANVRRHANASRVVITMQAGPDYLRVEIRDNGQGFNLNEVPGDRFGLRIMRERAASVGGRVTIESGRGEGTLLIVELPNQDRPPKVLPWRAELEEDK
jgi:nitrate/nitrite-specific signal transduction histidine kinase